MGIVFRARFLFALTVAFLMLLPALAISAEQSARGVSAEINIFAQPPVIYESIKAMGRETGNVKVLDSQPDHALLEETFKGLPIIGDAVCVYEEHYDANRRIDYHLVRSDKFKAFEGGWELAPA